MSDWFRDHRVGQVSLVKQEKVRLLSERLLSTSDWFRDRRVRRVSLVEQQVRKGKVVWPGGSHRRPTGGRGSLCRTGKDGKVSRLWGGKVKVVWPEGSRRHPTGD